MKRYFIMIMMPVVIAALLTAATGAQEKQKPIVPKKKMALWNGKDFTGWKLFVPNSGHDVTKTWSIKDGVIRCTGWGQVHSGRSVSPIANPLRRVGLHRGSWQKGLRWAEETAS